MNKYANYLSTTRQHGVALATALIFLVILTLLGIVAMRSSTTELRLALNEQARIEAVESAQAVVDAVASDSANLPLNSDTDYLRCYESSNPGTQLPCPVEQSGLSLGPITDGSASASQRQIFDTGVYAEARRLPPADVALPAQTLMSMDKFSAIGFGIRGQYARGEEGLGAADIEQGILSLAPRNPRIEY